MTFSEMSEVIEDLKEELENQRQLNTVMSRAYEQTLTELDNMKRLAQRNRDELSYILEDHKKWIIKDYSPGIQNWIIKEYSPMIQTYIDQAVEKEINKALKSC